MTCRCGSAVPVVARDGDLLVTLMECSMCARTIQVKRVMIERPERVVVPIVREERVRSDRTGECCDCGEAVTARSQRCRGCENERRVGMRLTRAAVAGGGRR